MMETAERVAKLEELLSDSSVLAAGGARFEGKFVSLADLGRQLKSAQTQLKEERSAASKKAETERRAEQAQATEKRLSKKELENQRRILIARFNEAKKRLENTVRVDRLSKEIPALQKQFVAAADALRAVAPDYAGLPQAASTGTPFRATGVPTGVSGRVARPVATTETATDGTVPPAGGTGGAGAGGAGTGGAGAGAGGAAAGQKTKGGKKAVTADQLAEAVQEFFPNYSAEWLSENGVQHFGQDLIDLFRRVAAPGSTFDVTTEAGKERIRKEIRKTVYWQTTLTAAKNFDQLNQVDQVNTLERTKQRLASTYGDLGLDDVTLTELARNVARNGLSGLGEQQSVYNTVFRLQQERPGQARRALEGQQADSIRQLARAYNFRVTDQQIQSILTGTPEATTGLVLTEEGLRQRMQKAVKGSMPQLAEQIDAGLTLEDIGANYRRYAAALLEKSEDQINMFDGPYLDAFGNRETGQLSLGEWTQKLKSDSRFGWQFTNQANRMAGDIALTIARAFGKVK
jgi:hypothetical protein